MFCAALVVATRGCAGGATGKSGPRSELAGATEDARCGLVTSWLRIGRAALVCSTDGFNATESEGFKG